MGSVGSSHQEQARRSLAILQPNRSTLMKTDDAEQRDRDRDVAVAQLGGDFVSETAIVDRDWSFHRRGQLVFQPDTRWARPRNMPLVMTWSAGVIKAR